MIATDTSLLLVALVRALCDLSECTTDPSAANAAANYAGMLRAVDPAQGEALVRVIRDSLNNHKTDFTDSPDKAPVFQVAREAAFTAAQAAANHYIGLRRPELAAVVSAGREA